MRLRRRRYVIRNRVLIEPSAPRESAYSESRLTRIMYYAILFRSPFARGRSRSLYNEADLSRAFNEVLSDESRLNFGLCANA